MIERTHDDCHTCDRLAAEAERTGREQGNAPWSSMDGAHVAQWSPEEDDPPAGPSLIRAVLHRYPYKTSDADYARSRGWGVGTRLIGDEGYGPTTITITAIGRLNVLAVADDNAGRESMWTFRHRDWQVAP